ncbi:MAG: cupin domain-containing protein [Promethearchaeota archaeon]
MYVRRVAEIKAENVKEARKTKIQWLITKKNAGASNFTMRRFSIEKGGEIPSHSHNWEHEIYILKGKGILGWPSQEQEVEADMVVYVPPNLPHWYKNTGDEELVFICIIPYKGLESF